jgi:predicted 3-demethylubiquinone-9 3-methyltransferase (glyoxalase superfamily)
MTDSKVLPFLLFAGTAEKATNFYVSWFPGKVENRARYGANQPDKEGSVMTAGFTLAGHEANPISPT